MLVMAPERCQTLRGFFFGSCCDSGEREFWPRSYAFRAVM